MRNKKDDVLRKCPTCGADTVAEIGLRDYSTWLFDALPGKAGGTDFDCVVERHGHFLMFEFKPNNYVPWGQQITFTALVQQGWTIYIVIDKDASKDKYRVGQWAAEQGVVNWYTMTRAQLSSLAHAWYLEASEN